MVANLIWILQEHDKYRVEDKHGDDQKTHLRNHFSFEQDHQLGTDKIPVEFTYVNQYKMI